MKFHCPICRKATDSEAEAHFPFCSDRCRLLDLGNWASERYKVSEPAFEQEQEEGAASSAPKLDETSDESSH